MNCNPNRATSCTDSGVVITKVPFLSIMFQLNAQSINAKFDCLLALIEVAKHQGISFHAICIQESWLSENADLSLLQIDGFRCYSQGKRCSAHGGLLTYISEDLHAYKINMNIDPTVWEGLFIHI